MAGTPCIITSDSCSSDVWYKSGALQHLPCVESKVNEHIFRHWRVITYLVDGVNKGLGVTPSGTTDHFGCLTTQIDCLNEQISFTLVGSATDQGFQGSFTRVEREGWSSLSSTGWGMPQWAPGDAPVHWWRQEHAGT